MKLKRHDYTVEITQVHSSGMEMSTYFILKGVHVTDDQLQKISEIICPINDNCEEYIVNKKDNMNILS